MVIKSGIIFAALVLGCLGLPTPETDFSQFFDHVNPDRLGRIVGGQIAPMHAYPHVVAMLVGATFTSFVCGGSILNQRTVLTAAHCIDAVSSSGSLIDNFRLRAGSSVFTNGGVLYAVSHNMTHEDYVPATIKNDVGLLYTTTNIILNNLVRTIPLDFEYVGANVLARAVGWGRRSHQGPISTLLIELDVFTISGEQCVRDVAQIAADAGIRAPPVEPQVELCTMHPRGEGHGMCNGDSGSPLVRRDRGTQIGIVSWGIPCARGAPDMFVRVSAFRSWIEQHIRN